MLMFQSIRVCLAIFARERFDVRACYVRRYENWIRISNSSWSLWLLGTEEIVKSSMKMLMGSCCEQKKNRNLSSNTVDSHNTPDQTL
jgi:hypothetical protein